MGERVRYAAVCYAEVQVWVLRGWVRGLSCSDHGGRDVVCVHAGGAVGEQEGGVFACAAGEVWKARG